MLNQKGKATSIPALLWQLRWSRNRNRQLCFDSRLFPINQRHLQSSKNLFGWVCATSMGRRQTDSELGRYALLVLFLLAIISCCMVYLCFSLVFRPRTISLDSGVSKFVESRQPEDGDCCRGIEHLELWGEAVKWGSDFKVNSAKQCCMACKNMCSGEGGPCLCDSWVFCEDKQACGSKFGEVWSLLLHWLNLRFFSSWFLISLCVFNAINNYFY